MVGELVITGSTAYSLNDYLQGYNIKFSFSESEINQYTLILSFYKMTINEDIIIMCLDILYIIHHISI